jgi:hypothetical protein
MGVSTTAWDAFVKVSLLMAAQDWPIPAIIHVGAAAPQNELWPQNVQTSYNWLCYRA